RAASALSVQDLAEQSRVRRDRAQAREDVPGQLREVRNARRRRRALGAARSPYRGGVSADFSRSFPRKRESSSSFFSVLGPGFRGDERMRSLLVLAESFGGTFHGRGGA